VNFGPSLTFAATHLAEAETSDRLFRRVQRMLADSGLPSGKSFETLDLNKWPEKGEE
jgi:hypothetical protein